VEFNKIEKTPKVSVCVITYNQEKYIGLCLQSILDQETDFDFEIIVGDDCSTDGTRRIIEGFAEKFPSLIKPIYQEANTGGTKNYLDVHSAAAGKYVAHMDGDDHALPGKLQRQATFLDQNHDVAFVVHRVNIISDDGKRILGVSPKKRQPLLSDIRRLVREYIFFVHSSKMYRRAENVFERSYDQDIIDFVFHLEHASSGLIGFLPDVLGCHRKRPGSITTRTGPKLYRLFDLTASGFDRALDLGVKSEVVAYGKSRYLAGAAVMCLFTEDMVGFRKYLYASRVDGRYFSCAHAMLFVLKEWDLLLRTLLRIRKFALEQLRAF
jgi:glycosyltransferase involved in cell wall biosynthesis